MDIIEPVFEHIQEKIIDTISKAEFEITAAVAWFTDWEIFDALQIAVNKGVRLRMLLMDDDINNQSSLDLDVLRKKGASVYMIPENHGIMHHKFCVIDKQLVIVGSYNWTRKAANYNMESILIMNDSGVVENYLIEFEKLLKSYRINDSVITGIVVSGLKKQLQSEVKILIAEISMLEERKAGMQGKLEDFAIRLKKHLGSLLVRYSELEMNLKQKKAEKTGSRFDEENFEQAKEQFRQAQSDVEFAAETELNELNDAERNDIRKLYREAAMMAHPDLFEDNPERQKEAQQIMAELSKAYRENNLKRVLEIWQALKDGTAFIVDPDTVDDMAILEAYRDKLLSKIRELESEVSMMERSEDWQIIQKHSKNLTEYFEAVKADIELRIHILEKELK